MKIILALATLVVVVQAVVATAVIFKRVTSHQWIYDDRGTGANKDLSIHRPTDPQYGYYAVGDVAVASHGAPSTSSVMVKEITAGSLARPDSFTEIWNDRGSGGTYDVRIMRMNPPSGFTCVGHVAILGYGSTPDVNKYRCVKNGFITTGKYEAIWLDHGSGARVDVGLWGNRVSETNTYALDANAFTSFSTWNTPGGSPPMMDGRHVITHQVLAPSLSTYIFTLYETPDLDEIWNDGGSGANRDLAVWRSKGRDDTYSLGDIAVPGGRPSKGFVVKEHKPDSLRPAYDFVKVWDDRGSGARWDGAFYLPRCPSGYRAIGHVAMRNHGDKPSQGDFRCVKVEYTIGGTWEWVWNDAGSGAARDVSVWKAVASGSGQGVEAMSSIAHHGNMNVGAYVLKPDQVNYVIGKPATKYILTNVRYLFDDREVQTSEPDSLTRTVLENRGDTEQTATREVTYSYEESYSWGNTLGLEIGITTEVSAGVPLVGSASVSTTVTASYSHTWGGSTTKSYSDTISVQATVKAFSQKGAVIAGRRYTADVPYEATLVTVYADGTRGTRNNFKGIYKGIKVNEIRVIYEADVPLTG